MEKMKQTIITIYFLSFAAFGGLLLCPNENMKAANPSNYTEMPEYEAYAEVITDMACSNREGQYALYDIDQDGVRELITSYGSCHADWRVDVYVLEAGKLVTMLDTIGGEVQLYTAPDGQGIYSVRGYQMYQEIQHITKEGDSLKIETIDSRQLGENENYYTNENPIKLVSPFEKNSASAASTFFNVRVTASDGGVNMRSGPGVEYEKVRTDMIPTGCDLMITEEAIASNGNSWGYTTYEGVSGWIALTQVQVEQQNFAAPYVSTVINCNESITLRRNPSVASSEICQIPLGSSVMATCLSDNDFIGVEYQGMKGYCLGYYLSSPTSYDIVPSTYGFYDVEVTAPDGGVNMRSGAGVEYDKVLTNMIPNGTILSIIEEQEASNGNYWGYTSYNGTYGWIALTQVSVRTATGESLRYGVQNMCYVINCNESITLREHPDINATEICQIPLGAAVEVFEGAPNGFAHVAYHGVSGFCLSEYLSDIVQ